ncbi:Flp family type IVb pilin [Novosphingobium huizhouense]|uniref:Flp family type IVb pilin n=1 Tax=Novosphingobium huizhouense TaxID=2866625 RepID=UPI001CD8F8A0|nr:hypothetical protein [Novosphingobium huizhouense]
MKTTLHKLLRDKTAGTVIEYGLLVAVFSTFVVFGIRSLAEGSGNLWSRVSEQGGAALSQH